jgi:hypothetical protein
VKIYEKHPTVDAYRFGPSFTPYAIVAKDKRFTDAELAAEYWKAKESVTFVHATRGTPIRTRRMLAILERFATLPHFDEVTG